MKQIVSALRSKDPALYFSAAHSMWHSGNQKYGSLNRKKKLLLLIPLSSQYVITTQISQRKVDSSTSSSSKVFKSFYCFLLSSEYTKYHSFMYWSPKLPMPQNVIVFEERVLQERWLSLNEVIRVSPNPIWPVSYKQRRFGHKQTHQGCVCTKGRLCEVTGRTWPLWTKERDLRKYQPCIQLDLGLPVSITVSK